MTELLGSSLLLVFGIYFYIQYKKKKDPDNIRKIPFSKTLENVNKKL